MQQQILYVHLTTDRKTHWYNSRGSLVGMKVKQENDSNEVVQSCDMAGE